MMVAYGYDHSGRPTGITYPQGSGTPDVVITYSNYGRTVTMVDGSGTSKWIHDGFDRLTRFEQPGWNIDYGYSGFDDTPVSMTDPSGVTGYQYDNRGNLWKLTNPVNEVTEWLYDPAGRLSQRKLGNGTWEEVSYDARSRVTGIALKKPGATLRQHTYGYNAVSNVTSHSVAGVTTSYGYDLADQLTSESRPGYAATYTYDANGNRATRTVNGVTETYVNDVADKLMSISVGGNTVRSFTYDGRGRRKTDTSSGNTTVYSWDAESRLVGMTKPGLTTSYGYNGLDARTSRTVGASTTTYKRAGAYVTDPVLNETTGQFSANYTPGVSERRAGVSTFLHSGLKNADARTTDGSSVTAHRQYDAFGNLTGGNGTWNGPFGYAGGFGYQEDGESGLKLLGHRYYDSTTGRFLSKDPIRNGRNWYGYANNNPITSADPDGLRPLTSVDIARLHKLRESMEKDGHDMAYINYITRLLKEHINNQPASGDAPGMIALWSAIDRLGDAAYGSAKDGINKCNKFVYDMYLNNGYPMPDRRTWPGTQPYGANYIGEASKLDNLFNVPADKLLPGDILAYPSLESGGARDSGHVTLVVAGDLLIYASTNNVKVGRMAANAKGKRPPKAWRHRGRR